MPDSPPELSSPDGRIDFGGGKIATAVRPRLDTKPAEIIAALGLKTPRLVIVLIGGADDFEPRLRRCIQHLYAQAIVPAAVEGGAAIVDGGTQAGTMAVIGEAVAEYPGDRPVLLGIAPDALVFYPGKIRRGDDAGVADLDPNHSHFVLTAGEQWDSGLRAAFDLVTALAAGNPVLAILVNGGDNARRELVEAVRRNVPVIVVRGSGRLADQVCAILTRQAPGDPELADLVEHGRFRMFPVEGEPAELKQSIAGRHADDAMLESAWAVYDSYNLGAGVQQDRFALIQDLILLLAVLATLLAILSGLVPKELREKYWALQWALIATPILSSALIAFASHFRPGNKWVLLRAATESVAREIYRYRARASEYQPERCRETSKEAKFQAALQTVRDRLFQTEANLSPIPRPGVRWPIAYRKSLRRLGRAIWTAIAKRAEPSAQPAAPRDDRTTPLSADAYVTWRLEDQVVYYQFKVRSLGRMLVVWRSLGLAAGGAGAFLAAVGAGPWVALTTALATAFAAKLEVDQTQASLVQYNQALNGLENLRAWWTSLSDWERTLVKNVDFLVETTEHIIEGERAGWVQQMQSAMEKLRKQQAEGPGDSSKPAR